MRWSFSTGDDIFSSPALADGVLYAGSNDGNFYAIDAREETEIWRATTHHWVSASPLVADGVLYIGLDGALYAFDLPAANLGAAATPPPATPNSNAPEMIGKPDPNQPQSAG
jgi:hypothetical protein